MEFYIIVVEHCAPNVVGPYLSVSDRDAAAKQLNSEISEDGYIFWMDSDGDFNMGSYSNHFMSPS